MVPELAVTEKKRQRHIRDCDNNWAGLSNRQQTDRRTCRQTGRQVDRRPGDKAGGGAGGQKRATARTRINKKKSFVLLQTCRELEIHLLLLIFHQSRDFHTLHSLSQENSSEGCRKCFSRLQFVWDKRRAIWLVGRSCRGWAHKHTHTHTHTHTRTHTHTHTHTHTLKIKEQKYSAPTFSLFLFCWLADSFSSAGSEAGQSFLERCGSRPVCVCVCVWMACAEVCFEALSVIQPCLVYQSYMSHTTVIWSGAVSTRRCYSCSSGSSARWKKETRLIDWRGIEVPSDVLHDL